MKPSDDESYRFLAARCLREQAKRLAHELVGVRRAYDIECVHQARVASRRLRTALGLFGGDLASKKMVKRWRCSIRRVTTGLGEARDCDVHAQELSEMLVGMKNHAAGGRRSRHHATGRAITWLLVDLERRREACQQTVLRAIDRIEKDGTLEEILHMAKEMLVDVPQAADDNEKDPSYSVDVFRHVGSEIEDQYQRLDALQNCLKSRKAKRRHHQMRIAAKRLRYTMEIAGPIYAGWLDESIGNVRQVQSLLGDIHDCDLWCCHLKRFCRARRRKVREAYGTARPFTELQRGFVYLRRRCKKLRRRRFDKLVAFWQELRQKGQWEKLLATLHDAVSDNGSKQKVSVQSVACGMAKSDCSTTCCVDGSCQSAGDCIKNRGV